MLLALGALVLAPLRTEAQVSGTIVISGLPVGGFVRFAHPWHGYYGRPHRYAQVVVVERWPKHRHRNDWRHLERRTLWYDRHDGIYYDGYRRGLVEVQVYAGHGRHYRPDKGDRDDRWNDHRDRHHDDR
jgi:hypothetical protein